MVRRSDWPIASQINQVFRVLSQATERCRNQDMRTPEVAAALKTLLTIGLVRWPFEDYWRALGGTDPEVRWREVKANHKAILVAIERGTSFT